MRRRFRCALYRACKISPARHSVNIALSQQLRIGVFHRNNAHPHMLRQGPFRRKTLIRRQLAGKNVGADAAIKRNIKGNAL